MLEWVATLYLLNILSVMLISEYAVQYPDLTYRLWFGYFISERRWEKYCRWWAGSEPFQANMHSFTQDLVNQREGDCGWCQTFRIIWSEGTCVLKASKCYGRGSQVRKEENGKENACKGHRSSNPSQIVLHSAQLKNNAQSWTCSKWCTFTVDMSSHYRLSRKLSSNYKTSLSPTTLSVLWASSRHTRLRLHACTHPRLHVYTHLRLHVHARLRLHARTRLRLHQAYMHIHAWGYMHITPEATCTYMPEVTCTHTWGYMHLHTWGYMHIHAWGGIHELHLCKLMMSWSN